MLSAIHVEGLRFCGRNKLGLAEAKGMATQNAVAIVGCGKGRTMKHGLLLALAATILVSACASSGSLYHPASSARTSGYSERKIEDNRYRVTFTGTQSTTAGVVQDYALLRAAELTLNMGFEWFYVVARETVEQDDGSRGSGFYSAGRSGRYCGVYGCRDGLYGGFIVGDFNDDDDRLVAMVDIVMGKGTKPPNNPTVYDAQSVVNNIRSGGVQ